MFAGENVRKYNLLLSLFCVFFMSSVNATECLGYFTNSQDIGISNQWGSRGDNFSKVNMRGSVSWPTNSGTAMYKSARALSPGNYATYSIALPKKIYKGKYTFNVSVKGKTPYPTPLFRNYNAWLIGTVYEGCRELSPGWNSVPGTGITGGQLDITLRGKGLPSGSYQVKIPYTLAWGTDPNESEYERFRGTWAEITPVNTTGYFLVEFRVENICDISGSHDITFNYGTLSPDDIKGKKRESRKQMSCNSTSDIVFSLSPKQVDLNNGVIANVKVKDSTGKEITRLNSVGNSPVSFNIESILDVRGQVVAGDFSGSSVLTITYQ